MTNQLVFVRSWQKERLAYVTVPCWVPVLVPITQPSFAYKQYEAQCEQFLKSHTGDDEKVAKEFELLLNDWRESDPISFSVNEIFSFARQLEAESIELTATIYDDEAEDLVIGYHGNVKVTFKKEGDKSDG